MKRTGSSHVRVKIVALLAALAALWSFAAYVTVRDGLNLLVASTVGEFGVTTSELVDALQAERRLSVVAAAGDGAGADEFAAARAETDQLRARWREEADSRGLRIAGSGDLHNRVELVDAELARLPELRDGVDSGALSAGAVAAELTGIIETAFDIFGAMASLDDQEIAGQLRALIELALARELLSQQDALLAGTLATGEVTGGNVTEITQLVGAQRFLFESAAADLHPDDFALFEEAFSGSAVTALRTLEDRFVQEAQPGAAPPFPADTWQDTVESAAAALRSAELAATDNVTARTTPVAVGVVVRLVLAGGLGLVALLAAILISVTTARALVRQLERLRDAARELAQDRLPTVVERLSAGERVNVAAEAPPLRFGDDEIGQVGQAFNAVQETAVRAAVQQAELRRGVRDVFLSLARRTQNLVHKQLTVVDGMERRVTDADEMEELYRIDHLATRMRRNAENLIVLSGASPGRTWRRPVSMIDVVRGAVAEVEDYTRVTLLPVESGALDGRAVGDVIHLLAELIENAASFSPPYAKVSVSGQRVAHGFAIEVEDRGLGMSEEELAVANQRLADPPDFSLADASRLGLYVVAKLAQRHGVGVHLRASPYGGVVAIVLVPTMLLVSQGGEAIPGEDGSGAAAPSRQPVPPPVPISPAPPGAGQRAIAAPEPSESPGSPAAGGSAAGTTSAGSPAGGTAAGSPPAPAGGPAPARSPAEVSGNGHPGPGTPPALQPPQPEPVDPPVVRQRSAADQPPGHRATGASPLPHARAGSGSGRERSHAPSTRPVRTPSGLPWRVRQASLPTDLWEGGNEAAPTTDEPTAAGPAERDPEHVRQMMRSYQQGTRQGRSEAAGNSPDQPADQQEG